MDCEGVNLSKEGRLTLIQIATPKSVYLFDTIELCAVENGRETLCELLRRLLSNENHKKIMHDSRRDAEALHYQLGVELNNVLDTQVLYAMKHVIGSGLRHGDIEDRIGLNKLLSLTPLGIVDNKNDIKERMKQNANFWETRYESTV